MLTPFAPYPNTIQTIQTGAKDILTNLFLAWGKQKEIAARVLSGDTGDV